MMKRRLARGALVLGVAAAIAIPAGVILAERSGGSGEAVAAGGSGGLQTEDGGPEAKLERIDVDGLPEIVFSANENGRYRLSGIDADGRGRTQVTEGRALDPAWSADGEALAYVSEAVGLRGTQLAIVLQRAGERAERFPAGARVISNPAFRDANRISLVSTLQTSSGAAGVVGDAEIVTVDLESGTEAALTSSHDTEYAPAWSPDGTRVAYVAGEAGCTATSEQACPQPLVLARGSERTDLSLDGAAMHPAWSPDGERLLVSVGSPEGVRIWLVDSSDGSATPVTEPGGADLEPSWAPDGERFVFVRDCDLWVQPLGDGAAENITGTPDVCELSPAWRPAGEATA